MTLSESIGVRVYDVVSGSPAESAGIRSGCIILEVNGIPLRDPLEYIYAVGGENEIEVVWLNELGCENSADFMISDNVSELGITLNPEPVRTCVNKCLFCFVDQMPSGMRDTLYVKDDDWRSSFQYGTYVTLTNVSESEITRIIEQRISPLYVSVHASDDAVRERLLGTNAARRTFGILRRLADAGIDVLTQAVICEGINDGDILERTIDDIYALHPGVSSLSVVPVGLTRFRKQLPGVLPVSPENATRIITLIEEKQRVFIKECGTRFVFASDELYLRSGRPIPSPSAYEDFAQIENGVGLVADFENAAKSELHRASRRQHSGHSPKLLLLTGEAFAPRLVLLAERIQNALPVELVVQPIRNRFFGRAITVGGLLTGRDIIDSMPSTVGFDAVAVPAVMFRDDGERALDDISFSTIKKAACIPCFKASSEGDEFIRQIEGFC